MITRAYIHEIINNNNNNNSDDGVSWVPHPPAAASRTGSTSVVPAPAPALAGAPAGAVNNTWGVAQSYRLSYRHTYRRLSQEVMHNASSRTSANTNSGSSSGSKIMLNNCNSLVRGLSVQACTCVLLFRTRVYPVVYSGGEDNYYCAVDLMGIELFTQSIQHERQPASP